MDEKDVIPAESAAKVVPDAASETDARGRVITVNRLNALQYYRLTKALGETASNEATMDMAILVAAVRKIDQTDYPIPATENEVEFMVQQLDFDGIAAAGKAIKKLSDAAKGALEVAKN